MSGEMMDFPNTVEEFMEQYKIVDSKKVYTNGTEFVPIFRMEQWFERHPEPYWTPVKYNPKKDGTYLITLKREDEIFVDALDYNLETGWGFYPDWGDDFIPISDVIAWMPVPEPYKEVEE